MHIHALKQQKWGGETMPTVFRALGFKVFFWSNEGQPVEPIHVHICCGNPKDNSPKFWLTSKGYFIPDDRYNHLKDMTRVLDMFISNGGLNVLKQMWADAFYSGDTSKITYYR